MAHKQGKKNRKVGRNKITCDIYQRENHREKNKIVRLRKHLTRFPDDECAKKAVERAQSVIRGY